MNETKMGVSEFSAVAKARAAFSSFLAIHFNVLPDEKFVRKIRRKEISTMLEILPKDTSTNEDIATGATLMLNFLKETYNDKPAQLSEKLGIDRTRLFRGISPTLSPPPPYEMVWSKEWQDVTLLQTLAGLYRENNLEISKDNIDRHDYLGLELDFLNTLAKRETAAWDAGKKEKAYSLYEQQNKFFRDHLEQWVPDFINKALEFSKTDFYHGHLLMLCGFISEQKEIFSSISLVQDE